MMADSTNKSIDTLTSNQVLMNHQSSQVAPATEVISLLRPVQSPNMPTPVANEGLAAEKPKYPSVADSAASLKGLPSREPEVSINVLPAEASAASMKALPSRESEIAHPSSQRVIEARAEPASLSAKDFEVVTTEDDEMSTFRTEDEEVPMVATSEEEEHQVHKSVATTEEEDEEEEEEDDEEDEEDDSVDDDEEETEQSDFEATDEEAEHTEEELPRTVMSAMKAAGNDVTFLKLKAELEEEEDDEDDEEEEEEEELSSGEEVSEEEVSRANMDAPLLRGGADILLSGGNATATEDEDGEKYQYTTTEEEGEDEQGETTEDDDDMVIMDIHLPAETAPVDVAKEEDVLLPVVLGSAALATLGIAAGAAVVNKAETVEGGSALQIRDCRAGPVAEQQLPSAPGATTNMPNTDLPTINLPNTDTVRAVDTPAVTMTMGAAPSSYFIPYTGQPTNYYQRPYAVAPESQQPVSAVFGTSTVSSTYPYNSYLGARSLASSRNLTGGVSSQFPSVQPQPTSHMIQSYVSQSYTQPLRAQNIVSQQVLGQAPSLLAVSKPAFVSKAVAPSPISSTTVPTSYQRTFANYGLSTTSNVVPTTISSAQPQVYSSNIVSTIVSNSQQQLLGSHSAMSTAAAKPTANNAPAVPQQSSVSVVSRQQMMMPSEAIRQTSELARISNVSAKVQSPQAVGNIGGQNSREAQPHCTVVGAGPLPVTQPRFIPYEPSTVYLQETISGVQRIPEHSTVSKIVLPNVTGNNVVRSPMVSVTSAGPMVVRSPIYTTSVVQQPMGISTQLMGDESSNLGKKAAPTLENHSLKGDEEPVKSHKKSSHKRRESKQQAKRCDCSC